MIAHFHLTFVRYARHYELSCKRPQCLHPHCSRSYDSVKFYLPDENGVLTRYRQLDRRGHSQIETAIFYVNQRKLEKAKYIQVASRVFLATDFVKKLSLRIVRIPGDSVYAEALSYLDLYKYRMPKVDMLGDAAFSAYIERVRDHERLRYDINFESTLPNWL